VPVGAGKVNLDHSVIGPLGSVPSRVGQEEDMGQLGDEHRGRVILGGVEGAILKLLAHGVHVVRVLSSCPGDVKDGDGGDVVLEAVSHVDCSSREYSGVALALQVLGQTGLAVVASSISDPDDVTVISRYIQHLQDMCLPGTGDEARVIRPALKAPQAIVAQRGVVARTHCGEFVFEVGHREVRILLDGHDSVVEGGTTLLALASRFTEGKGTSNSGVFLVAVVNGLLLGATAFLQGHGLEQGVSVVDCSHAHGLGQLDVALPVNGSSSRSAFDLEGKELDVFR